MVNLIGSVPDVGAVLAVPGAHLHLYGKAPRPARKLGHVTVPAEHLSDLTRVLGLEDPRRAPDGRGERADAG
jgi:5-(carboxyamino)imidazole ribonucleotide synthase